MFKVKIGNDVKLNIVLKDNFSFEKDSVKSIQAEFINTETEEYETIKDELDSVLEDLYNNGSFIMDFDHKTYKLSELEKCISWDLPDEFIMHNANKDRLHLCGPHGYHIGAWNVFKNPQFGRRFVYEMGLRKGLSFRDLMDKDLFSKWALKMCPKIIKCGDVCNAFGTTTDTGNTLAIYLPAKEQKICGIYDLVIQVVVYEEGWGEDNLHTYTFTYKDIIELTEEDSAPSDITIDVGTGDEVRECHVGVLNMTPPNISGDNVNTIDQPFELRSSAPSYNYDQFINDAKFFQYKKISGDCITVELSSRATSLQQNFVWIMSPNEIKGVSFENSFIGAPFVEVSSKEGEHIYALSNPVANMDKFNLNIYF